MTGQAAVVAAALLTAGLVAAPVWGRRLAARRLARVVPASPTQPVGAVHRLPPWLDQPRLGAALGALAVVLLIGGWWGFLAAAGVAAVLDRLLRRLEPASVRAERLREAVELPLAADLLAVALRGGAPVERAAAAVADVLPGPLGRRLGRVARLLRLGAPASEAWTQLAPVAGAERLVRAAVRSADHGGALAGALRRLADDLRADRAVAIEAAARRAGVLIVLPLGLCFLPAFILAGLVPVIVAVLGDVL
jgi:pilus assembly protein TadC